MKEKFNQQNEQTKKAKIIHFLIDLIEKKHLEPNELMPSEHFLMDKFNVSRITAINAYQQLEGIGAIYTRNKLGRYVAENFSGLAKAYSSLIKYEYSETNKIERYEGDEPQWFYRLNIIFLLGHKSFKKIYFNDKKEEIMFADHYVSRKYELPEEMDGRFSILEHLTKKTNAIRKMAYKLKYEKVDKWGFEYLVVIYAWGYDDTGISVASRYIVHPDYFVFFHTEKNL
ncbi:winged helix-turn-helix domain-containing protein [Mesomycoplasma molare]|uniref:GntR family transcriptional regulator n=1 Tax=Mesomycoplasma molare TaxID=171288 RepID=A0ABY5TXC8_9BACT|nr:GntR family transcriptional regulator [Mesomycoplasma molare]UWD34176.1 GntR family transcriptional regulator [Mesomycoplasma molare]